MNTQTVRPGPVRWRSEPVDPEPIGPTILHLVTFGLTALLGTYLVSITGPFLVGLLT